MRNKVRDKEVNTYYTENGWYIKRIWEHTIKIDLDKVVEDIIEFINTAKSKSIFGVSPDSIS